MTTVVWSCSTERAGSKEATQDKDSIGLKSFGGFFFPSLWSRSELNNDLLLDLLVGSLLEDYAVGLLLHVLNEVGPLSA